MKIIARLNIHGFILATTFFVGLGPGANVAAQEQRSFLIDLNSKTATEVGISIADNFNFFGIGTNASAINSAGQVAGGSEAGYRGDALITGPNGVGARSLGFAGHAFDINDAGQVVGTIPLVGARYQAFITGPNGADMRDLGVLAGGSITVARRINNLGEVVGTGNAEGGDRAFITGPNGTDMRSLGTLDPLANAGESGGFSVGQGINDAGQVVGYSTTPSLSGGGVHAFITGPNGAGMKDIGTLGFNSFAREINNAGQVVGDFSTSTVPNYDYFVGPFHAFITGPDGAGMRDLGALGGAESHAYDINDVGQVVGSFTSDKGLHAFVTGPNGAGMTDLNSLVTTLPPWFTLSEAVAINNSGQILAFVTGIPEPETYALLLSGLALVGFIAQRKKLVPL